MNGTIHLIGVGGVGSWLAYSLCKLVRPEQVKLYDGDILELKNLDRQFFSKSDLGKNKAVALSSKLNCDASDQFYSSHTHEFGPVDWLICCSDNNAARRACLEDADHAGIQVIIAANEKTSAEAYYYDGITSRHMRESQLDPRVYIPELANDDAPDPRAQAIGCTGVAQEQTPQLVSANFMAASLAQWLFVLWAIEVPKLDTPDNTPRIENLPYRLVANVSRLEHHLIRDALKKGQQHE